MCNQTQTQSDMTRNKHITESIGHSFNRTQAETDIRQSQSDTVPIGHNFNQINNPIYNMSLRAMTSNVAKIKAKFHKFTTFYSKQGLTQIYMSRF